MTVQVIHEAQFTCDRCGKVNTTPTTVTDPGQVPLPDNWRKVQMLHPDVPDEIVVWILHPACARDFQEKFGGNVDCPPRDPST